MTVRRQDEPGPAETVPTHLLVASTQLGTDRVRQSVPEVGGATKQRAGVV